MAPEQKSLRGDEHEIFDQIVSGHFLNIFIGGNGFS
jgi:hypothetical protein